MNKLTKIYLVRHGESESNALKGKKHDYEGLGTELTETGKKQAQILSKKLENIHFDAIFSSDMLRTKQTAEIVALEKKLAVETTDGIRENSFFRYVNSQGRPVEEIQAEMLSDLAKLDELGKMNYKHTPSVESPHEAATRLIIYLREIAVACLGKTVMVVAHGNLMRSLLPLLGYAKYDELPAGSIINTGYIILECDGVDFFVKETYGVEKKEGTFRTF